MEGRAAEPRRLFRQPPAQRFVARRAFEQAVQQRFQIKRRATDEQDGAAAPGDFVVTRRRPVQPPGHARRLPRLQHVQEVMRHAAEVVETRLGGADVHVAVERHRIHRNDFGAEALGQLDAEPRLARAGRPGEDQSLGKAFGKHATNSGVRATRYITHNHRRAATVRERLVPAGRSRL